MAKCAARWQRIVAGVLLAGLGSVGRIHHTSTVAHGQAAPSAAGSVIIGLERVPQNLNPLYSAQGRGEIYQALYTDLITIDSRGHLVPGLLTKVPSLRNHGIRDGGRTIILTLKRHQYWSSGVEITSADIVFGWQAASKLFQGNECYDLCSHIASVEAHGRYGAIMHLPQPYAPILTRELFPVLPHLAPQHLHDPTVDANVRYWTDGPYQVASFDPGYRVVLTPNRYYHLHSKPSIRRLIFTTYPRLRMPPDMVLVHAAATGQADVTGPHLVENLPDLRAHQSAYRVLLTPTFDTVTLQFNVDKTAFEKQPNAVHSVRVRQALALALDRSALVQRALGVDVNTAARFIAYTPYLVTPGYAQADVSRGITGAWDPIAHRYLPYGPQALQDARTLLREAGYPHGLKLRVTMIKNERQKTPLYSVLQHAWSKIGVRTQLNTFSPGPLDGIAMGYFQVLLWSTYDGGPDPDDLYAELQSDFSARLCPESFERYVVCTKGIAPANFSDVQDPLIDRAFARGRATFNQQLRRRWYQQIQVELAKQAYWTPIYYAPNIITVDRHVVGARGYPFDNFYGRPGIGYSWNVYQWKYRP